MKNVMMVWGFALLAACTPAVRQGIYACETNADCPKRQVCEPDEGLCFARSPQPSAAQAGAASAEDNLGSGGTSGELAPPPSAVCGAGKADCNADAADACETAIVDDAQNCGGCGKRCEPSDDAVASCDQARCMQYSPSIGKASAGAAHGGKGGSMPLALMCPAGQVLVGAAFTVATESSILVQLEPRCAPLKLAQSSTGRTVVDHGDVAERPAADVESGFERTVRDCASQTVVTSVRGAVEEVELGDGETPTVVTQLGLRCSRLTFGPQAQIMTEPASILESATDPDNFEDACPKGEAVVGFSGASDNLIGWLKLLCAPIVSYQEVETVTAKQN